MRCHTERRQQLPSDMTLSRSDVLFSGNGGFWLGGAARMG